MLRRETFRLPRHPASVGFARYRVRQHLATWGHDRGDEITERVVLLASELAANVVRHGPILERQFELAVTARADGSCFIAVSDESSAQPVLRAVPTAEDEMGRGLHLVDQLAQTWGVRGRGRHGKTVWAVVRQPCSRAVAGMPSPRSANSTIQAPQRQRG
ncbi:ATP-binding protein [Streptomyces sp. NBC_01613]|uniref:ATP-binding protein n=1 Tax=Streptomyces sp. NBC_01613 TaxID=2975896 RepID=UPI00386C8771